MKLPIPPSWGRNTSLDQARRGDFIALLSRSRTRITLPRMPSLLPGELKANST